MNYLKQFSIILLISFIGEIVHGLIPVHIPAGIYGIVILFLCLEFKIIKVENVKEVSSFLIEIMPVMFIPAAVGLLDSWEIIKASWIQYLVITIVTTVIVMVVAGRVTQFVIKHGKKADE